MYKNSIQSRNTEVSLTSTFLHLYYVYGDSEPCHNFLHNFILTTTLFQRFNYLLDIKLKKKTYDPAPHYDFQTFHPMIFSKSTTVHNYNHLFVSTFNSLAFLFPTYTQLAKTLLSPLSSYIFVTSNQINMTLKKHRS